MATVLSLIQFAESRETDNRDRDKVERNPSQLRFMSLFATTNQRDSHNFLRVTSSTHSGLGNLAPTRIRPPGLLFGHTTTTAVFFLLPFSVCHGCGGEKRVKSPTSRRSQGREGERTTEPQRGNTTCNRPRRRGRPPPPLSPPSLPRCSRMLSLFPFYGLPIFFCQL